jgi:FixJ family two-component response regulator
MASISDLTPREVEILQFVIPGKVNKTIACEMYISEKPLNFTSTTFKQRSVCERACARKLHVLRAMIRPRRQVELRHRGPHQALTVIR